MRVLVLTGDHDLPDPTKWAGAYDAGDLELHGRMRQALESLPGYRFEFLSRHAELLDRLRADPPELVLNLCDTGLGNVATHELHVPALLEVLGAPYTGAPPASMVLCYDKAIVRMVAAAHDVAVPRERYVAPEASLEEIEPFYPALIKPNHGDGSVGITRRAVVHDDAEARDYLDWLRTTLPGEAALWQEYLPGPEYGLALVGNPRDGFVAFPPLEVDFSALPEGLPPILAFESKTGPETPYQAVRIRRASLPDTTVTTMRRAAETLFRRLQCQDYARFDFRVAADGRLCLMEVNPNPAWSAEAKMAIMAGFAGTSYPELLGLILDAARRRIAAADAGS